MSDDPNRIDVVINEIVIRHGLNPRGEPVYTTDFTVIGVDAEGADDRLIPFVEGLGLLEAAKQDFIEQWAPIMLEDE